MKTTEIALVRVYSEDWDALYANGRLVSQGHRVHLSDFALWLSVQGPVEITGYSTAIADEDWACDYGQFPEKLEDVKMASDD